MLQFNFHSLVNLTMWHSKQSKRQKLYFNLSITLVYVLPRVKRVGWQMKVTIIRMNDMVPKIKYSSM